MTIEAIPTVYNNREYRSRLEADMAQLLDRLTIPFEYEARSYLLSNGQHFRPDFFLWDRQQIVETRGYTTPNGDEQLRQFGEEVLAGNYGNLDFAVVAAEPWHVSYQRRDYPEGKGYRLLLHRDPVVGLERCSLCQQWSVRGYGPPFCASCDEWSSSEEPPARFELHLVNGILSAPDSDACSWRRVSTSDIDFLVKVAP